MDASPIKSAERTLILFELFAVEQRPLAITEISESIGMPQSSTSVLVKSLVTLGYLEHDAAARKYYPTLRIALLGTWMRRRHEVSGRLPKMLSVVAEKTGESAVLAMRNGIYAQYLLVQIGADPLRLHIESSQIFPLACCSVGWAMLSAESDAEIGKIVRRTQLEAPRSHWRATAEQALANVKETRENGYAFTHGQTVPGAGAISILLPPNLSQTRLAIGSGGPYERIQSKKELILESLHELSNSVTQELLDKLVASSGPPK